MIMQACNQVVIYGLNAYCTTHKVMLKSSHPVERGGKKKKKKKKDAHWFLGGAENFTEQVWYQHIISIASFIGHQFFKSHFIKFSMESLNFSHNDLRLKLVKNNKK